MPCTTRRIIRIFSSTSLSLVGTALAVFGGLNNGWALCAIGILLAIIGLSWLTVPEVIRYYYNDPFVDNKLCCGYICDSACGDSMWVLACGDLCSC